MKQHTLHLRRRIGETVLIGPEHQRVAVKVQDIQDGEATLIFRAPADVTIDRLEVARRKQRSGINTNAPALDQ